MQIFKDFERLLSRRPSQVLRYTVVSQGELSFPRGATIN